MSTALKQTKTLEETILNTNAIRYMFSMFYKYLYIVVVCKFVSGPQYNVN